MKLKLSLFILLFVGGIPISCREPCDGLECPPITGDYFDIVGVDVYNHTYQINGDYIYFFAPFDDSLDLKGLVVDFDVNYVSTNTNVKCKGFNLFMNSAIADECICPENGGFGFKGRYLKELHVITINDFNDEFSANDTLNEIIYLNNYPDYYNESYSDGSLSSKYLTLQDFIENEHLLRSPRLHMTMIEQPDSGEPFQVKVVVELLTGETYENISTPWL